MLENTIEKLDIVDEKYHSFYTEKEGKFELDEKLRGEDTEALLNAKNHERDARKAAEDRIKEFETKEAENAIKLAEAQGDKDKAERLKQQALDEQRDAIAEELKAKDKRINDLTVGKLLNDIARQVYINPDDLNLSFLADRIKLDDNGNPYVTDISGATITPEQCVSNLREDEAKAYAIKAKSGSGGGGGNGGGNSGAHDVKNWSELTMDEKKAKNAAKRR